MLCIKQLQVAYGETLILRDVDLEVEHGRVVCLMGRNGVGKTTLLKSIMGLLRPRSGQVIFEDKDLTRASPDKRARAGLGYVPQGREIFPQLTVRENLQVGFLANPSKRTSVLYEVLDYFPMLKDMLDRKGGVLSGGQQQQLAIARALVAEPKLLILDEPTEGIQPSIITLIGEVLRSLKEAGRVTILLVEQYFEFALKLADYCYVMEKGAIVMRGNSAEMDKEAIKPYLAF
ncbi:MAG TPA: urea ABC transporter ATP-binding subunit UrtE [Gemmataceae bacterium]|jgi:urea transport system ATP-binding protein|nr:urea ABC transporter ATP-binding subunit UrtE [Gemmataceae bacterium]